MLPSPIARGSIDSKSDVARCKRLFVYGTLLSSATTPIANRFHRDSCFVENASVTGLLYAIASYPGLRDGSAAVGRRVKGEVYELNSESTLAALDEYEGYDPLQSESEFERVITSASLRSGGVVDVWMYRYMGDVSEKRLIESGDFSKDLLFSPEAQRRTTP